MTLLPVHHVAGPGHLDPGIVPVFTSDRATTSEFTPPNVLLLLWPPPHCVAYYMAPKVTAAVPWRLGEITGTPV
jgi:hypothetical protein